MSVRSALARGPNAGAAILFFSGSALAFVFFAHTIGWWAVVVAGAISTAIWVASGLPTGDTRRTRWRRRGAQVALFLMYLLWTYLALTFGVLLAWTTPTWIRLLVGLTAVAAAATIWRPRAKFHVPAVLPLGLWIAAVLAAWGSEEKWLRCDDYLALQAPVELIVPSHPDLQSCRPGEMRPAGRFPRTIWESPDGLRLVFTTQGEPIPGGIDGALCEVEPGKAAPPHCVGRGEGKVQGLIDAPEYGRLIVMQWGLLTPNGVPGAVTYEVSRDAPLQILAEHWFEDYIAEGFYEARNSTVYMFSDRMNGIHPAVLPSFTLAPTIPIEFFTPGEIHYDTTLGEGIGCGSHLATALRGAPFEARKLVTARTSWIEWLSLSWGCDWDPVDRKAYVAVPNLGLLERLDYDSGAVEARWFVGPGMRSVAYDRARRRVYFTDFLRGNVIAFDERSQRVVARWFVGRFARWVRLTHDGRALLATSNLGIVRIPLDPPA